MTLPQDLKNFHAAQRNERAMDWLEMTLAFAMGVTVALLVVVVFGLERSA